jgi:1-acyl-sn-glycerol-3-phosphate acyltransferase
MATPVLMPEKEPIPFVTLRALVGAYFRLYHRMEVDIHPEAPMRGPFIALTSHFSNLDTAALFAVDPYTPKTTSVVKASLFEKPVIGSIMRARALVPVSREGRDVGPLRNLLHVLKSNRGMCLAAEGRRSRTGRLGPINKVVVKLAARAAREEIPVFPVAANGTFESLPTGARWPRPRKIHVIISRPIDLSRWKNGGKSEEDIADLAKLLQDSIAGLLPPERRPSADTPALAPSGGNTFDT